MLKAVSLILISFLTVFSLKAAEEANPGGIEEVKVSPSLFNPSQGEKCTISYKLSSPSPITIKIRDENSLLVRTLLKGKKRKSGSDKELWDGKDDRGIIVPPEAYTFTIEGKGFRYDSVTFSGGELLEELNPSARKKPPCSISYTLPTSARVRIRIGVKGGPLYRTLLNWEPRPPGSHSESWDGRDKTGKVNLASNPLCFIFLEAFSLPDNSIIVSGPPQEKKKEGRKISEREINSSSRPLYEHARHPRWRCKDPEMKIILPEGLPRREEGIPILSGECPLRIEVDDEDLKWLREEKFEYIFYVDDEFLCEEEEGAASPYIWCWDSRQYKDGKHLLSVNLRSFSDHCATDCLWVYVRNKEKIKNP